MDQKLETVATFTLPIELAVAKTKLESEGISCHVVDELTIQTDNFLSNAIGGVKLQVPKSDIDTAHQLLVAGGFINEKQALPTAIERKLHDPGFLRKLRLSAIVFFLLIALILIMSIFTS